jgi:hypothetical protein
MILFIKCNILTSSYDDSVWVWDARTGKERLRLEHDDPINQAQWNQDESLLMVVTGNTVLQYYTRMEDLLTLPASGRRAI